MNPEIENGLAPISERMAALGRITSVNKARAARENGALGGAHTESVETRIKKREAWDNRRKTIGYSKSGRKVMTPEGSARIAAANRRRAEARRAAQDAPL